ncbi:MAG TPA: glycosyl hydrolase [Edaphobacter sp.]
MSSGPGDLSRLYKTTDGCRTWKLLLTNPDKDGFWDAIQFSHSPGNSKSSKCFGEVVGDPINGHFALFLTVDCGDSWEKQIRESPPSLAGESLFAASNSSLSVQHQGSRIFVTGGKSGARILRFWVGFDDTTDSFSDPLHVAPGTSSFRFVSRGWIVESLPNSRPSESSGAFSVAENRIGRQVIVGGDYKQPDKGLAWYQERYALSHTLPHGYRSAVAYDEATKTWITVGPNGTDISRDDGLNWSALKPSPQDQPDADRNWNALSLPFVVGPKGRIGKLHPNALPSAGHEQD